MCLFILTQKNAHTSSHTSSHWLLRELHKYVCGITLTYIFQLTWHFGHVNRFGRCQWKGHWLNAICNSIQILRRSLIRTWSISEIFDKVHWIFIKFNCSFKLKEHCALRSFTLAIHDTYCFCVYPIGRKVLIIRVTRHWPVLYWHHDDAIFGEYFHLFLVNIENKVKGIQTYKCMLALGINIKCIETIALTYIIMEESWTCRDH